jgi:hypothetical protein
MCGVQLKGRSQYHLKSKWEQAGWPKWLMQEKHAHATLNHSLRTLRNMWWGDLDLTVRVRIFFKLIDIKGKVDSGQPWGLRKYPKENEWLEGKGVSCGFLPLGATVTFPLALRRECWQLHPYKWGSISLDVISFSFPLCCD